MADAATQTTWLLPFLAALCAAGALAILLAVQALRRRNEHRRIAAALGVLGGHDADPVRAARVASREALRLDSALAELRAIVENAPVGIVALDALGRIATINPAATRIFGIGSGTAAGAAARHPEGRLLIELARAPELEGLIAAARETGRRADAELAFESASGARIARCALVPLTRSGGKVAFLLVLEDLTELRRLEAVRTDFVANVSHELRTPITTIRGFAETLADGFTLEPQARRFIDTINRSATRLGRVIDDLLLLSSLEDPSARHEATAAPVPLAAAIQEAAEQHAPAAEAKRISIQTSIAPGLAIQGNVGLIAHAVGNLLANAIKYSPEGTTVRIDAAADGTDAVIAVRDQGPGIAEHHQARLFERFYRVDRARDRGTGGTGLGLAIVKHVALVHGGSAEVESQSGRGSTFRLRLPMPVATQPPQPPATA